MCNMGGVDFVDYGYFYDIDHKWYYIIPGPFRIKMPLELIKNRLDEEDHEFDFRDEVGAKVASFILQDYQKYDSAFADFLKNKGYDEETTLEKISEMDCPQTTNYLKDIPLSTSILMIGFLSRQMPIIRKYQKS